MKKWMLSLMAATVLGAIIYQIPQTTQTANEQPVYMGGPTPAGVIRMASEQPVYMGGPTPAGVQVASEQPVYMGGPTPAGIVAIG